MLQPGGMVSIYRRNLGRKAASYEEYCGSTDAILEYPRTGKKSYAVEHDHSEWTGDSKVGGMERKEEHICYQLYANSRKYGDGSIFDYQVPLRNRGGEKGKGDSLGKIDLVYVQGSSIILLETKRGDSNEAPLHAVTEICTYYRTLDKEKFLANMMAAGKLPAGREYRISCGVPADTMLGESSWMRDAGIRSIHRSESSLRHGMRRHRERRSRLR